MHGLSPTASTSNPSPSSDLDSDRGFEEHDSLLDPFDLESDEDGSSNDESLLQNTRGNSGPNRSKALLGAKIPLNPFPSILASDRRVINMASEKHAVDSHKRPGRQYDVDSFTRLLLTGEGSSPRESKPIGETYNAIGTKITSSAPLPAVPEPRLDNHQYISQGSPGSSLNDERRGLVSESDSRIENMRPAASQHHHGKPTEGTFQETISTQDLPSLFSGSTASPVEPTSWSTPSSPINLNKPLPPPPAASGSQALPFVDTGVPIDINVRENTFSDPANLQNSNPHLPLVSRYSSHTRLNPLVVTSERLVSGSANGSEELQASSISHPPSSSKPPPPPPPPRRHGRARGVSSSSTSSAISGASASLTPSSTDEFSSRPFKQQPVLPPARTPSNSSMTRPTRRSTHADSPSVVPPPAPPPRRETSRSSYSRSGQLAEYLPNRQHSDLWALWASPPTKVLQGQEISDTDVLAGLSELQREVDELRGKFRG